MADIKLKDREILRQSEEDTAILAAVADETLTGETRKLTIPGMAAAQHRENPLVAVWESTTLWNAIPGTDTVTFHGARIETDADDISDFYARRTVDNTVAGITEDSLDFKVGNSGPRHSFADDYLFFVLYTSKDETSSDFEFHTPRIVNSYLLTDSSMASPLQFLEAATDDGLLFAKLSDTQFTLGRSQKTGADDSSSGYATYLWKIEGVKLIYRPESL